MNQFLECAKALREDPNAHHNCAQAVLEAFAPECGLTQEQAAKLGAHFGSGMKIAATCGAITGALMVIGMLGGGDDAYRAFMTAMKDNHEGMTNCADLLKKNAATGCPKKQHCDGMVYEAVENVVKVMHLE
jgi:C_GCAxxG_C_C family probable redox protein